MVNALYDTTKSIRDKTGHELPKTLACKALQLARDVIAKAKDYHLSTRKEDETEVHLARAVGREGRV
jgi:hypothetical protein